MMSLLGEPRPSGDPLVDGQYADSSNLDARIQLHTRFSTGGGWYEWLFSHFRLPATGRLLELGCGSGRLWKQLADRVPEGWEIMLTDLSPGMLDSVRQELTGVPGNIRFQVVDAQAIPFAAESFDAVVANHMLYHVPDRDRTFAEARRVIRSRGQFYAATNGTNHLCELDEVLNRLGIGQYAGIPAYGFTLESGEAQLAEWFDWVTLDKFEDALEVTEVEPLVAYVKSTSSVPRDELKLDLFRDWAQQELDAKGTIHITKASGLFTAS